MRERTIFRSPTAPSITISRFLGRSTVSDLVRLCVRAPRMPELGSIEQWAEEANLLLSRFASVPATP